MQEKSQLPASRSQKNEMEIPNPASKPQQPDPITVAEVEAIAAKALSKQIYEFYASGSDEQKLLKRNMSGYDRYMQPSP